MNKIDMAELLSCVTQRWTPEIGDPSLMGWVTVFAYGAASLLCFGAATVRIRDRRFWGLMGLLCACLCDNKQLDLQSALTVAGRCLSQMQGWYDNRRAVQFAFILGLAIVGVAVFLLSAARLAPAMHRIGVALTGFGVLIVFVAIRAAGMHHVDALAALLIGGARITLILELSGIALIFLNAAFAISGRRARRHRRKKRASQSGPGAQLPFSRSG